MTYFANYNINTREIWVGRMTASSTTRISQATPRPDQHINHAADALLASLKLKRTGSWTRVSPTSSLRYAEAAPIKNEHQVQEALKGRR